MAAFLGEDAVTRMQEHFWFTREMIRRRWGHIEDEGLAASDSRLDARLGLLNALTTSCRTLLKLLPSYETAFQETARAEGNLGKFLRDRGRQDRSKAGRAMLATGRAFLQVSQNRATFSELIPRLERDIDTFVSRAIADTSQTISKMETTRTRYRGAILWLQNAVRNLDPDRPQEVDKFRRVQNYVRRTRIKFEKLKLDTLQKIELLLISRCNLFSKSLQDYQSTLQSCFSKSAKGFKAIALQDYGYQPYDSSLIQELSEKKSETDLEDEMINLIDDKDDDDNWNKELVPHIEADSIFKISEDNNNEIVQKFSNTDINLDVRENGDYDHHKVSLSQVKDESWEDVLSSFQSKVGNFDNSSNLLDSIEDPDFEDKNILIPEKLYLSEESQLKSKSEPDKMISEDVAFRQMEKWLSLMELFKEEENNSKNDCL